MKTLIEIERFPYEEPYHINLIVKASNEICAGQLEIYDTANSLRDCASALNAFPRHSKDSFVWELGSERLEDNFAFYFRFRVLLMDSAGHTAIQLRFNNNEDHPEKLISEFCITCEPAGVNRLGKLFGEFAKLRARKLIWDGVDGEVIL